MKCPVAKVLRWEMLEYKLIPYLKVEGALSTTSYLHHFDLDFEGIAQVFLSFFLAAGNRMLFRINRYPGECLCRLKSVGGSPIKCL